MLAREAAFVRPHRRRPPSETSVEIRRTGRLRYFVPELQREFDYSALECILKLRVASSLAEAHLEYLMRFSRSTALEVYHAIRRLAEHTSTNKLLAARLKRSRSIFSGAGAALWQEAVAAQVTALQQRPIAVTTFAEYIGNLFRSLDELTSRGITAECRRPVLPNNYHASGKHRPGLVEQSSKQPLAPELLAALEAHIDALNLPIKGEEARELLRALAAQVPIEVLHNEVAVAEVIFRLNSKALADIRDVAEKTFLHWREVRINGQNLLRRSEASVARNVRRSSRVARNQATAARRALFSPELGDEAVINFLSYLHRLHGERVPAEAERRWPIFMKRAFWQLGGREFFDACFCLHRRAVAAAVILYLVDSGANVSTALSLTTDSEQETDDPDFVTFVSFKNRAGPQPIVTQLPLQAVGVKVTAAQALRDVKEMTQSRRELFPELLADKLFIHTFRDVPSVLTDDVLADNLRYMLRDLQMPQAWTPSAIRVAVAVEVSGKTNGDLVRVGRKLSHAVGSAATPIYGLRFPVRLALTQKIREYQTLLEAAFSTHAPEGPQTLGYSPEVADFLVDKAARTGLGFLCRDPTARGGKVEDGLASCPDLGQCAGCHVRLFLVDVESLAEMFAVHDSLASKLDEYEEGKQDAWVENWLDLYAFSTAVVHKAKSSRFAYLIPAAKRKAQQMLEAGFEPMLVKE